jgi:hypothetical protein
VESDSSSRLVPDWDRCFGLASPPKQNLLSTQTHFLYITSLVLWVSSTRCF